MRGLEFLQQRGLGGVRGSPKKNGGKMKINLESKGQIVVSVEIKEGDTLSIDTDGFYQVTKAPEGE